LKEALGEIVYHQLHVGLHSFESESRIEVWDEEVTVFEKGLQLGAGERSLCVEIR